GAQIKHLSGVANATVFWREAGDPNWVQTAMAAGGDDSWATDITVPGSPTNVEYYISATANSGKTLTRPIVAPEGFWTMQVENLGAGDFSTPQISGGYPNPTTGNVTFNVNQTLGPIQVTVYNTLGQTLTQTTQTPQNNKLTVQLQPQWEGTLFVTFTGNFGSVAKKIIKR
ncbi:MAG: T9SS type A sorting domain-containing protein, partial [Marinirhabdus sp.]